MREIDLLRKIQDIFRSKTQDQKGFIRGGKFTPVTNLKEMAVEFNRGLNTAPTYENIKSGKLTNQSTAFQMGNGLAFAAPELVPIANNAGKIPKLLSGAANFVQQAPRYNARFDFVRDQVAKVPGLKNTPVPTIVSFAEPFISADPRGAYRTAVNAPQNLKNLKSYLSLKQSLFNAPRTAAPILANQVPQTKAIPAINTTRPSVEEAREMADQFISKYIPKNISVKQKVNLLDYYRTPENVLKKIGLGQQARFLRQQYDSYIRELPVEIGKITEWSKRVRPESNQKIFKYLDGQKVSLDSNELKVATEIRSYLKDWANRLNLPEEKRISNYITHIFDKDFIQKDFPSEIASLIRDKIPGSVYDPFTQERLGKFGYIEDTWRALDAYVKRATRKVNMDPALDSLKAAGEVLEDSQFNYIKKYADRINLRPTETDTLIDNLVKSSPIGYRLGQRPVTGTTKTARQMVYRGLLGLNPASALRNLSQGANTYAKLGEKYTVIGYSKVVQNLPKFLANKETELERVGVLDNGFVQDRQLSAVKGVMERLDKGLFYLFEQAEKINRGAAYYGAKAKAINQGMSEQQAIEVAKELVRKTQFSFGSIDTPVALQSDVVKTFSQFQSYSAKQIEFLGEMVAKKDFAGLARYLGATMLWIGTVGKLYGADWKEAIPGLRIGVPPTMQLPWGAVEVATGAPDKYGNPADPNILKRIAKNQNIQKGIISYIPGGSAIKRGVEGVSATAKGYSESQSGRVRFPIEQSTQNYIRSGLFGQYSLPEARDYFDSNRKVLSEKQSEQLKVSSDKTTTYSQILEGRENRKYEDQVKELVATTGVATTFGDKYFYLNSDKSEVNSIDIDFKPTALQLTGNSELDKKRIAKYRGELTRRENIVLELVEQGQLSESKAETELAEIKKIRAELKSGTTTGIRKPKKITFRKSSYKPIKITASKSSIPNIKIKKPKKIKLALKKPKTLYDLSRIIRS